MKKVQLVPKAIAKEPRKVTFFVLQDLASQGNYVSPQGKSTGLLRRAQTFPDSTSGPITPDTLQKAEEFAKSHGLEIENLDAVRDVLAATS